MSPTVSVAGTLEQAVKLLASANQSLQVAHDNGNESQQVLLKLILRDAGNLHSLVREAQRAALWDERSKPKDQQ